MLKKETPEPEVLLCNVIDKFSLLVLQTIQILKGLASQATIFGPSTPTRYKIPTSTSRVYHLLNNSIRSLAFAP